MRRYYDKQGNPITMEEWASKFDREDRRVGSTVVGEATVSTVHLGLNHAWDDGPPLIFETMIFGGPHDSWQDRYSTLAQAEAGHRRVVADLEAGRSPADTEERGASE